MKNVYFDTCVYHQPGIDLLFKVIGYCFLMLLCARSKAALLTCTLP